MKNDFRSGKKRKPFFFDALVVATEGKEAKSYSPSTVAQKVFYESRENFLQRILFLVDALSVELTPEDTLPSLVFFFLFLLGFSQECVERLLLLFLLGFSQECVEQCRYQ